MAREIALTGGSVVVVALLLSGRAAGAVETEPTTPPSEVQDVARPRASAFFGVLGGPVVLGVEVVRRFGRFFELTAGGGLSPSPFVDSGGSIGSPFTWSVMPRLRLGGWKWDLTMGVGLSGGPEEQRSSCGFADDECTVVLQRTGYLTRLNGEVGAERWADSGFAFRLFAGYGYVLDQQDFRCVPDMPTCPPGSASGLYVGVGLGYAF